MVVRCVADDTPSLVIGNEYVVLAILGAYSADATLEYLVHLPEEPITDWALYKAQLFEVVDGRMAPNWIFSATEHGFYFEPAAWTRPGHWDDLFCNDRAAVERAWSDHRAERDLILAHAGRQAGREGSIGKICGPPDQPPQT